MRSYVFSLFSSEYSAKRVLQTCNADEVDEDDEDYVVYNLGDKAIRVSTAHTEEKANALNMLSCYAEHMNEHFAPYCAEVAKIVEHVLVTPLLNNEEMRHTCACLVPLLIKCMLRANEVKSWPNATDAACVELFILLMQTLLKVCVSFCLLCGCERQFFVCRHLRKVGANRECELLRENA
jgi:hypothetical protein